MPSSPQGPGQAAAAPSPVDSCGAAGGVGSAGDIAGSGAATPGAPLAGADDGVEPDVKQIIDHIDRELS